MNKKEKEQEIIDLQHFINTCNRNLYFIKVYLNDKSTSYVNNIDFSKLKIEYSSLTNSKLLIFEKDIRLDTLFENIDVKKWETITTDDIFYAQDKLLILLFQLNDIENNLKGD